MPDQRIQGEDPQDRYPEEQIDNIVLTGMLCSESWPWSVQELARELGNDGSAIDSVRRLGESGLVHRCGEFVFPTRTARRAAELQVGTV